MDTFAPAVLQVEDPDPEIRRLGLLSLEKFEERRAMRVVHALTTDSDLQVANSALRIMRNFRRLGLADPITAQDAFFSQLELIYLPSEAIDEILFVFRRKLKPLLIYTVLCGLPTLIPILLLLFLAVFGTPISISRFYFKELLLLCAFLQLLVFRPVSWFFVGKTILSGIRTRDARRLESQLVFRLHFWRLWTCCLLESLFLAAPIFLMIFGFLNESMLLVFSGLIAMVGVLGALVGFMPTAIFFPEKNAMQTLRFWWAFMFEKPAILLRFFPPVLLFCVLMYFVGYFNTVAFREFFDLGYFAGEEMLLCAYLLIDPLVGTFYIGGRIILTNIFRASPT